MEAGIFNIHTLFVTLISHRPPSLDMRAILETGLPLNQLCKVLIYYSSNKSCQEAGGNVTEQELSFNRAFVLMNTVV